MKLKPTLFSLTIAAALALPATAVAQDVVSSSAPIIIEPLFEYPVAPDSIPDLTGKSEWIVEHFWDQMDFKGKNAVDQNALNDALQVFISPMRWTSDPVVDKALNTLFKNLEKNPTLTLQFTRAAEEALYGPRAIYWSDPVYLRFIDNMLRNKKIPSARKERFIRHKRLLENSRVGDYPKAFDYTTPTGTTARYAPTGVITVIEFGDPECDDCRLAKLKMETDVTFSGLVDKGAVNVLFIIPDPSEGWQTGMVDFSPKWHAGASDTVADIYDIRSTPSFYVIGRDGKIIAKNVGYRQAMGEAVKAANAPETAK
jgi:hypothetical protein B2_09703